MKKVFIVFTLMLISASFGASTVFASSDWVGLLEGIEIIRSTGYKAAGNSVPNITDNNEATYILTKLETNDVYWYHFSNPVYVESFRIKMGQSGFSSDTILLNFYNSYGGVIKSFSKGEMNPSGIITPLNKTISGFAIIVNSKMYNYIYEFELYGSQPEMVSQIVAVPLSHHEIKVTWTEPEDDPSFAGVEIMLLGQTYTVTKGTTEYIFSDLWPSTRYDFTIRSISETGMRSESQSFHATTLEVSQDPPPEIQNLVSYVYADSIKFTWDNPPNVDHHEVRIYRDGVQIATAVTPANQFTDYGLNEHTTYTFVFFTVTIDGRKSEGMSVTETTKGKPRVAVEGVYVTPGDESAEITFFPHPEATEGYAIYLDGQKVATWTETSGVITDLQNDQEYTVQVAAINEWGEGPKSSPVTFMPEKEKIPEKPEVKAYVSKTTIRLEWNPVKFAKFYRVYDDQNALVAELAGTQYEITGIQPGTTKKFFVTAVNNLGESEKAEITAVTSEGIDLTGVNLPFNVDDFLQAVFDFARLFGPYLVLALVLWFAPNIINFFKKAIDKRSRRGVK